jgi:glutathione S-transferase
MNDIILYSAPGTCARVTAIVLEELGLDFETRVIRFMRGEHKQPEHLARNPLGKVPCLKFEGRYLTENVAIIEFLDQRFPEAELLPRGGDEFDHAEHLADLCFCAATLHPIVTRIRMPHFTAGPEVAQQVYEAASKAMQPFFELIEKRLSDNDWWYGKSWHAMDAYLYWIFWRVEGANFDLSPYPAFTAHARAMEQRPAVQQAIAREEKMTAILESEGLLLTLPSFNSNLPHR